MTDKTEAMDNLIAQDADLIEICPDDLMRRLKGHSEIMERDKGKFVRFIDVATCTEAVDRIEAQAAEIERLVHDLERQMTIANEHVDELETFKQEVSDALLEYYGGYHNASGETLERFIIPKPKPDPLTQLVNELDWWEYTDKIRAALDALGFEIREKGQ